jgi:hypothetical protein
MPKDKATRTVIEGNLAVGTVIATTTSSSYLLAPVNIPKAIEACIAVAILLANSD